MPVLLNERLYKHKKAIRILTPLPPSGNVITLCIGYCIYFLIFHSPPSVRLSFCRGLLPCMHSIFILTLNGISSLEIRYQPGCPLLFQPRSEDSSYDLDTARCCLSLILSFPLSNPVALSPFISILTSPLPPSRAHLRGLTSSPASPIARIKSNGTH